ncbi:helix-turn-helix domain-containing protein [Calothrix sp. UHCC 0171]|uniref:helix-turn-helix domain-containing protein n=1 Tax=Calothrix sp. UHCC 0171 TaxID=3110245 RepID=UPI002B201AA7|nr:helix-turn-helix domain-containing protein [Calothrix sp. UHCC 0171]MEA5569776.1 helix-turn-helix domain-containing protein [Calothrix sp. UHCC 0171]
MIDFTPKLQSLIQQVAIPSLAALSRVSGVSERQILRLRRGEVEKMRIEVVLQLSQVLQVSLDELVTTFSQQSHLLPAPTSNQKELCQRIADLEREYLLLQQQLEQQSEKLQQQFQQESLQLLESFLVQFPTAAQKARENPQLPAVNMLPLIQKPLKKLLQAWGVEVMGNVGEELCYEPQFHQLVKGSAEPGDKVTVQNVGYRQGDKLLYRVRVCCPGSEFPHESQESRL